MRFGRTGSKGCSSVPGESFLAALDGLYASGIQNPSADRRRRRHDGRGAGQLTGRPGGLRHPRAGATNASAGVHVARQDSTPMILFVGQIARADRDREAFQEVDYRAMFGPLAKWVAEIDQTGRIPEYVARAFHLAMSGRPQSGGAGPAEDMLSARAEVGDLPAWSAPLADVAPAAVGAGSQALAGPSGLWWCRAARFWSQTGRRRSGAVCGKLGPTSRRALPPAGA